MSDVDKHAHMCLRVRSVAKLPVILVLLFFMCMTACKSVHRCVFYFYFQFSLNDSHHVFCPFSSGKDHKSLLPHDNLYFLHN